MTDYTAINRANWEARVSAHVASPDYAVERYVTDPAFVSGTVAFDRPRLGDLAGVRGVDAEFVLSEVANAFDVLEPDSFDLVYTGIGALCWLPSLRPWASVVAGLLRPGGRLFVREGHPMLFALDDEGADDLVVRFSYFEHVAPVEYDSTATYVETDVVFDVTRAAVWNHGVGDLLSAVLGEGLTVTSFVEHDSVPWNALPGLMVRGAEGEWRPTDRPDRVACSYTLQAVKAV